MTIDGSNLVKILSFNHNCCAFKSAAAVTWPEVSMHAVFLRPVTSALSIFPHCSPSLGGSVIHGPLMSCHSKLFILCALTSYEFLLSLLTTAEKLLWPKQTIALLCEHKHSYLQGSLTGMSCLFRKIIAAASPLGPMAALRL